MRIRIRIQKLKLMRIHADPDTDPDPKPCRYHTYRTMVKRIGAVGDLDLNVIDRNVILRRGYVLDATAYLAHFPSRSRRQNFRQSFLLDLFVVRGYSEHFCANSEELQINKVGKIDQLFLKR